MFHEVGLALQLSMLPGEIQLNLPISTMTTAEKLAAMEELWASLQADGGSLASPEWHGKVLAERKERIDRGETTFYSLDEVRVRLESRDK